MCVRIFSYKDGRCLFSFELHWELKSNKENDEVAAAAAVTGNRWCHFWCLYTQFFKYYATTRKITTVYCLRRLYHFFCSSLLSLLFTFSLCSFSFLWISIFFVRFFGGGPYFCFKSYTYIHNCSSEHPRKISSVYAQLIVIPNAWYWQFILGVCVSCHRHF